MQAFPAPYTESPSGGSRPGDTRPPLLRIHQGCGSGLAT